jgi:excisionase family DNA binding protein
MPKKIDPSAWVTQSEAARIRGVSRQSISELVKRGRLKTTVVGSKKLVKRSEIEQFRRRKPGPKRKTKKSTKRR